MDKKLVLLVLLSIVMFSYITYYVYNIEFIGYMDAGGYAEIADSLLHGKGLTQEFADFFYTKFETINHRTTKWFSLYSLLIVPLFLFFGKTAFLVKLPSLLSYLFIPWAAYFLGAKIFNKKIGFFCGLTVLFNPKFIDISIQGLPDLVSCLLSILAILFLFKIDEKKVNSIYVGLMIGLAYLIKPSAIFLMLSFFIFIMITKGRKCLKPFLLVVIIFIIVISPLVMRNFIHSGDMIQSDYKYMMFGLGYEENIYYEFFGIHWDNPPSLKRLVEEKGLIFIAKNSLANFKGIFLNDDYYFPGLKIMLMFPLSLFLIIGIIVNYKNKKTYLLWIISLVYILAYAIFYIFESRYFCFTILLLFFLAWDGFFKVGDFMFRKMKNINLANKVINLSACFLLGYLFIFNTLPVLKRFTDLEFKELPFRGAIYKERTALLNIFDFIKKEVPLEAVIMTSIPIATHFHTERKTISIPYEDLDSILDIMQFYNIKYFLYVWPKYELRGEYKLDQFRVLKEWTFKEYEKPVILYEVDYNNRINEFPIWSQEKGCLFPVEVF